MPFCGAANAEGQKMNEKEAQKIWSEYHNRIMNRRISQAKDINLELENDTITSNGFNSRL